ncbi:mechanosensitive ion channel domain-containing protein [Sphingomonas sp.]|uniref:mechanosensitive ion channel family protein n=1 Tax=Sphingomonas sp. TaxID=28214 RepID=UPI0017E86CF5|nr:mechanosensitive ion channel domain-containing protein [Sphingomonas sp.]MBA3510548.1 mechanosensitive ion channel [Sphingomonas sp.]
MAITRNSGEAVGSGRGTIEAIARWFEANRDDLPTGLAVAAGIVAVMLVLRGIGAMMSASDPECTRWRGIIGRVLVKTSVFFMIAAALDIVVTFAVVPPRIGRLADILFIIAAAFQGAVWARELILGVIGRRARDDDGESTLANAMTIIRVLVSVALFAIAIIVILDNVGVNVTALIAGLGIGGIAIGLAAQGIFSDLFAALAILIDRPFRRGDTIRYGQSVGTVEKIGLKTTRLRSLDGQQLVMANTKLLEQEIHNYAAGHSRRTTLTFGLVYQTPPELLERVPELARSVVANRSGCTLVRCAILGFGPSSIDFELIFDSATTDPDVVASDRTAIVTGLMRMFALNDVEFAYPTQTTFTAAPDGTLVMPYAPPAAKR